MAMGGRARRALPARVRRPAVARLLGTAVAAMLALGWIGLAVVLAVPNAARDAVSALGWHRHALAAHMRWWIGLVNSGAVGFAVSITVELVMMIVLLAALVSWADRRAAARRRWTTTAPA